MGQTHACSFQMEACDRNGLGDQQGGRSTCGHNSQSVDMASEHVQKPLFRPMAPSLDVPAFEKNGQEQPTKPVE